MDIGSGNRVPTYPKCKIRIVKNGSLGRSNNSLDETKERELGFSPLNKESEMPLYANAVYHSESVSGYGRATCGIGCEISVL